MRLCLPQYAENGYFEAPTYASEVQGAPWADEGELTGDEARQFANPKNSRGRAVVDHGGSNAETRQKPAPGGDRNGPV